MHCYKPSSVHGKTGRSHYRYAHLPLTYSRGGPVITGNATVLIGGLPAATIGDQCTCIGPPDTIVQGSFSVLIGGRPAARMGDMTAHGGVIVAGCPTVLIGDAGAGIAGLGDITKDMDATTAKPVDQMKALALAANSGSLGCEHC